MELLIIFFLILLNGIFSMSEIALVSARKFKLETAAKKGNKNAQKALDFANDPNIFLSTVQIGITLIGILTGIYSGEKITDDVKSFFLNIPFLADYAQSISVVVILIVLTFFSIVFGELIPKRIGMMFPESIAMLVARPMTIISIITKPFIWLLTKTNDLFLGIFGLKNKREGIVSEEEIKSIIQDSTASGEIQEIEQNIVERVFALGDRKVRELMTHRSDLIWIDVADSFETIKNKAAEEIHSVYIVADKSLDEFIGVLFVKELFPLHLTNDNFDIRQYIRKPFMVTENTAAYKVLEKFKETGIHYAVVVDEYGSLQGLVAMDDVMDALIGDATEYNQTDYQIIQRDENSWLADAQLPYYQFAEYFELEKEDNPVYNTLAGLIIHHINHIPTAGEQLKWKKFTFEIVDMDGLRIDKVLIKKK
jgi:putative hemolysin